MTSSDPHNALDLLARLVLIPPFDRLGQEDCDGLLDHVNEMHIDAGAFICEQGMNISSFCVIEEGNVEVRNGDAVVSHRGPGDVIGERALMRDGRATLSVVAEGSCKLLTLDGTAYVELMKRAPRFAEWFTRIQGSDQDAKGDETPGITSLQVSEIMTHTPITCGIDHTVGQVARIMRDHVISSVMIVEEEDLVGIVTVHDMNNKVLAEGLSGDLPIADAMTANPITIGQDELGLDALIIMVEKKINHLPVVDRQGKLVGMIGKTDMFRAQAATASQMVAQVVEAQSASDMRAIAERLPDLLSSLVATGAKSQAICRRITDFTDAATRRLLRLAEEKLGPAPVPYVWAACGSQGRREQTGVSDQDNCLIIDDSFEAHHEQYFKDLANYVCDGLNEIGFVYCPGDMMASNPRWRQPLKVWKDYFVRWIAQPDNEAQMLASVMFDLRPISGTTELFDRLQSDTLEQARRNSIFTRHMIGNSLKHTPPLSLFGGLSLIGSGEHKNALDLKHAGVVPIVDLGRVYALKGALKVANTRERILAAGDEGIVSPSGVRDLLDAYDLIAQARLVHQAALIKRGEAPDNYLKPETLSDLERKHLRDAFMVVKTMQSAVNL